MKLARINTLLLVSIILVNLVTIGLPFVPELWFHLGKQNVTRQTLQNQLSLAPTANQPNRLIMPAAVSDQEIYEGPDERSLRQGVWHRPHSSTPDKGGNTVFAAHRFTYRNPRGAFYHLDKLKVGDSIGVIWDNKLYRYIVQETKVVGARDSYIEKPTTDSRLTLYTCTPLSLPKDRLVVIATPLEVDHE